MNRTKRQHYVPRFYLAQFSDSDGQLHVFDKWTSTRFRTSVENIAVIADFYEIPELAESGFDPNLLETQFSNVEGDASKVLLAAVAEVETGKPPRISDGERQALSLFIVLQMLRTVQARNTLMFLLELAKLTGAGGPPMPGSPAAEAQLHASVLWDDDYVQGLVQRVFDKAWVFGKNDSPTLFLTSDHPGLIKDANNRGFTENTFAHPLLDSALSSDADYLVFPLSPRCVLYCYDRLSYPKIAPFDMSVSPVSFTTDMVNHENAGQVGLSSRFVISADGDFSFAMNFIRDQPWVANPQRAPFESHPDPYEAQRRIDEASRAERGRRDRG